MNDSPTQHAGSHVASSLTPNSTLDSTSIPTEPLSGPVPEIHAEHRASFAEFGGWNMPVTYAGTVSEHNAVRTTVGLFDVSHLGKAYVRGPEAAEFINGILTNDLQRIGPGKAQYTLCTAESGGVIDDLIVYYESPESLFLIPNAANTASVVQFLQAQAEYYGYTLNIENAHRDFAIFAVQGPLSRQVLAGLGIEVELEYMAFVDVELQYQGENYPIRLCRTGYTGEWGYEVIPRWKDAAPVFRALIEQVDKHGGQLAGLGARDTLRTEMGYALHGHELSPDITPVQAGIEWAVGWKKPKFVGKRALEQEKSAGPQRKLYGIVAQDKGIPRAGFSVKNQFGKNIGTVTSGTFSPTLAKGIALALLDTVENLQVGDAVTIDVRGRNLTGLITSLPLVESHVR